MDNQQTVISSWAQFIMEAILIFLITVPFMHAYFQWIPYGSYFAVVGLLSLLFSFYSVYSLRLWAFVFTGASLLLLFYVLNFPLLVNIFLALLLPWRYLVIRGRPNDQPLFIYFVVTSFLVLFLFFLTGEGVLLLFIGGQFLFTLLSYFFKDEIKVKNIDFRAIFLSISFVALGAFSFLILSTPLIKLTEFVYHSFFILLGKFVGLFEPLEEVRWQPRQTETFTPIAGQEEILNQDQSIAKPLTAFVSSYIGISLIIIFSGILFFIILFRKRVGNVSLRRRKIDAPEIHQHVLTLNPSFRLKRFRQKPLHPARKMVYELEREMNKLGRGRQEWETVEAWLTRLGFPSNLPIYQRVRYGEEQISRDDIKKLQQEIKRLREFVKQQEND